MSKITIKNISSATITLIAPNIRFRRELAPRRTIPITTEEYEELSFDTGFIALLNGHYISISGIEDSQAAIEIEGADRIYEATDIEKMFDTLDITAFAKFIPTAAQGEKDTVVKLAVDKGITNSGFTALIKKYCGVDVINAISMKHQAEEK